MATITQKFIDAAQKIIGAEIKKKGGEDGLNPDNPEVKEMTWLKKLIEELWSQIRAHRAGMGWEGEELPIFTSPVCIELPRKTKDDKRCYLNLNNYRNWKHFLSNDIKTKYVEIMKEQLEGQSFITPIELKFTYYKGTNRITDRANILSVTEKFFCDALVHYGCIPDDNDEYIKSSHYFSGKLDSENPRVEVQVLQAF